MRTARSTSTRSRCARSTPTAHCRISEPDARNRAKALIEDFMIAANGVTARYLNDHGYPSLRRVLRSPERWQRIVDLAAGLGGHLPAQADARALDAFLVQRRAAAPAQFAELSLSVVKLIGSGEYVLDLPGQPAQGHFGLAVSELHAFDCARTAAFPDLIAQRLLKAALGRRAVTLRERRARDPGEPLHHAGRQRRQGRATGTQVGRRATPCRAHRRAVRRRSHRSVGQRHLGAHLGTDGRRARRARLRRPRCRRRGPACSSSTSTSPGASSTSSASTQTT